MERTLTLDVTKKIDQQVTIEGWVLTRRDHGKLIFLDLWDRLGKLQVVIHSETKNIGPVDKISPQSAIRVIGQVNKRDEKNVNSHLPTGEVEVFASQVEILGQAASLPFDIESDLQIETFLDHAPITLRSEKSRALFKVQSAIAQSFVEFFTTEGFTQINTPKLVASSTEGGTDLFPVEYFKGQKAFLAQSPQLYKQIMVGAFERVFEIAPVFRNEPHATARHINEYVSLDMEMAFIKDHYDIITITNKFFRFLNTKLEKFTYELNVFEVAPLKIPESIPTMTLLEAQEILKKEFGRDIIGEPDLEPGDEKMLSEHALKTHDSDLLWVTEYPTKKKPFYAMPVPENPEVTRYGDLILRGAEVISGGQRINNYDQLVQSIKSKGLNPEHFDYYLDAFKYGMPPEGGFGMGLERLTSKILKISNIKLATLFPRDMHRLTP
jgi:nondiscriminating aspartyl-tRNA synthetase